MSFSAEVRQSAADAMPAETRELAFRFATDTTWFYTDLRRLK
jgi:hypothetical protein